MMTSFGDRMNPALVCHRRFLSSMPVLPEGSNEVGQFLGTFSENRSLVEVMLGVQNGSRHEIGATVPPISGETSPPGTERNGRERFAWLRNCRETPRYRPYSRSIARKIGEQVGQHVSRVAMM
jgi:hypothetical protein